MRGRKGENDRNGLQGVSLKRGRRQRRRLKGRRQGERVAGGRITGGQKKRLQKKVGGGKATVMTRGVMEEKRKSRRRMLELQLRHCSPPVISASPLATRSVCVRVCACVCVFGSSKGASDKKEGFPGCSPYRSSGGFQVV